MSSPPRAETASASSPIRSSRVAELGVFLHLPVEDRDLDPVVARVLQHLEHLVELWVADVRRPEQHVHSELHSWETSRFFKAVLRDTDRDNVSTTVDIARTEAARLEALLAYGILDTPPEQAFDDLIELAAGICYTPVAAVVFVDADRAWLKAKRGVEVSEFPRDAALASEALKHADVFAVRDALADERYHESAVVKAGFRFFAGMPLVSPEGHALGAVCVLDTKPRELSSTQKDALRAIARQVMNQLELRRVSRAESLARHKFSWLVEQLPGGVYIEDLGASSGSYFSPQVERITGYSAEEWASGTISSAACCTRRIATGCSARSRARTRRASRSRSSTA